MQIVFVFFHSASLFWGIWFPFHYRKYKQNGYLKYIHFSTVAIAVLAPLIPGLSQLSKGFVQTRFPTSTCVGRSGSVYYYTLLLPVSILLGVTVSLLVLIYWTIVKVTSTNNNLTVLVKHVHFLGVCYQEDFKRKEKQQNHKSSVENHVDTLVLHHYRDTWTSLVFFLEHFNRLHPQQATSPFSVRKRWNSSQ